MSFARIETLRKRILEREVGSPQELLKEMTGDGRARLQREVEKRVISLHFRIGSLKEILDESFEGRLDLGTDPERIRWDQMPEKIAACFQPEFERQPEDITEFSISIRELELYAAASTRQVRLMLGQGDHWQRLVNLGVTTRPDYHGGPYFVYCSISHGQQKEAREAGFNKFTWGSKLTGDRERNELKSRIRGLDLTDAFLEFTVGEMERQVGQASE